MRIAARSETVCSVLPSGPSRIEEGEHRMPHYTIVTKDGVSLGAVELAGYDWKPGMTIFRRAGDSLRVLDVLETDDSEVFAILKVEPA